MPPPFCLRERTAPLRFLPLLNRADQSAERISFASSAPTGFSRHRARCPLRQAPEASSSGYTCAVDIYSAGATFYELFETGARFEPPTPQWAVAPGSVRPIIGKMCALDATSRPQATDLIVSFQALLRSGSFRQRKPSNPAVGTAATDGNGAAENGSGPTACCVVC